MMQTDKQKIAELEAENERLRVALTLGGNESSWLLHENETMKEEAERYRKCIQNGWLHPEYDPTGREWD